MKTRQVKRFGYIPDLGDARDLLFTPKAKVVPLPDKVDLRPQCPAIYDQLELGSCTSNAIAAAFDFEVKRQGRAFISPSRLLIYFNERVIEGTTNYDSGAMLRDGIKTVVAQGVCPETEWPYDIARFREKPPDSCYTSALLEQALEYRRIRSRVGDMRSCLAQGLPFVFGFTVYESFMWDSVATNGIVFMPGPKETVEGGHAVLCVGYDHGAQKFIVRNSWSAGWALNGYCLFPYEYLSNPNLTSDRWVISKVE